MIELAMIFGIALGWLGATIVWERAIRRRGVDPNVFREPLRDVVRRLLGGVAER